MWSSVGTCLIFVADTKCKSSLLHIAWWITQYETQCPLFLHITSDQKLAGGEESVRMRLYQLPFPPPPFLFSPPYIVLYVSWLTV